MEEKKEYEKSWRILKEKLKIKDGLVANGMNIRGTGYAGSLNIYQYVSEHHLREVRISGAIIFNDMET